LTVLALAQLHERRRSLLSWGLPIGLWSAFVVAIYPSIEGALGKAVASYPESLKQAFGIAELSNVEQYLNAEMLSLIVPLAVGYLAVRSDQRGRGTGSALTSLACRPGLCTSAVVAESHHGPRCATRHRRRQAQGLDLRP